MVVLCIQQRGDVEVQVHLSRARYFTIDRSSDHRAMFVLYPGILQHFTDTDLWSGSKDDLVMFPYRILWIHTQDLRRCIVKSCDYA